LRRHLAILLLVVAAIGGVVGLALNKDLRRGLDLQGGIEVVLQAQPKPGQEVTTEDLDQAIEVIRSRIDEIGVNEPEIRRQGGDQITVSLAGIFDQQRATDLIGKTAVLEFYDLEGDVIQPALDENGLFTGIPEIDLYTMLVGQQARLDDGVPTQWFAFGPPTTVTVEGEEGAEPEQQEGPRPVLAGPAPTEEALLREVGGELPEGGRTLGVPFNRIVLSCSAEGSDFCPGSEQLGFAPPPGQTFFYLFRYQPDDAERPVPELTGESLERRGTRQDFDSASGEAVVLLRFNDEGGDRFHDVTRALADRGAALAGSLGIDTGDRNQRQVALQRFAIVLDGEIRSTPTIDFVENPDGIAGGSAQISGLTDIDEAKDLAVVLQTGSLPVQFVTLDTTTVSATLGKDSMREAWIAAIGGLAAVAVFLLLFYRFLGVIAIIGLGIYGALVYGAILLFNVTLTLPGFAGMVLTIGVAADANVVIFERIKEEVRLGRSVRAAIGSGYRKGFNTIVDANVVTMITAFVLFAVATSGVRGFALMLLVGTLLSMLTAVLATRALLGVLSGFRWFDNPAFMGASAQRIPRWQRIDVNSPKRRRIWLSIATSLIVASIIVIAVKGLNLGIDFKGGSQLNFGTPAPAAVDDVRATVDRTVEGNAIVQGRGDAQGDLFSEFQVKTDELTADEQTALTSALTSEFALEDAPSVRNVSGSFSSQILRNAIIAIVVSFVLIALYITLRFQWRFAIPILRTFLNDILITLGVYALVGRELTTPTVAALLTILGYSIYDTIIVFDRVRENMPLMKKSSFAAIANQSLWETIRRSLATTFITLLPVASLLVFGGDTLKDFAFALLVGIGLGALSTIFVATPFLTVIMERTPEYAKLKGVTGPSEKLLEPEPEEEPVPAALEPAPAPVAAPASPAVAAAGGAASDDAAARREARRQRRRSRPHGRAR
jgi:SecD/SecF fusion protein